MNLADMKAAAEKMEKLRADLAALERLAWHERPATLELFDKHCDRVSHLIRNVIPRILAMIAVVEAAKIATQPPCLAFPDDDMDAPDPLDTIRDAIAALEATP